MTHTRAFRALAAVLSVWLGICLAQPMQLHLCEMHGGLAIESGGHADAHMSHDMTHHPGHSTPGHEKSQCSCLGDCTTGSAPAFVGASQLHTAIAIDTRVDAPAEGTFVPVSAVGFLLPYSNGPPSASSPA